MKYHFIGLGGIGMSALARILIQKGERVQGSDQKNSSLLTALKDEGVSVHIGHNEELLGNVKAVVYSTGVNEENVELKKAKEKGLKLYHRSDLLNELAQGKNAILVSGTHGKTTTGSLLAHVLVFSNFDPSFAVGGIINSLKTNAKYGEGEHFVMEADESDGSFLKTSAYAAILTNLEDDHLDYWGSGRMLDLAFQQFIAQTQHLFWCMDDERLCKLKTKGTSYGFSNRADLQIKNFRQTSQGITFDLGAYPNIFLPLFGRHNALNAAAVFALCKFLGVDEKVLRSAFENFSGVQRRLQLIGEMKKVLLFDDYGHHPNEIKASLKALRGLIKERRLICIFQPHRYSRVKDHFQAFLNCFEDADLVVMTDIYSAGESFDCGMNSAALYAAMRERMGAKVQFFPRTHLESGASMLIQPFDVVITMGAGDITYAGEPILNLYSQKSAKYQLALLCGGLSQEREVSLASAKEIQKNLDPILYDVHFFHINREGNWVKEGEEAKKSTEHMQSLISMDIAIPCFHGPFGEDGMIAAFLQTIQVPYVGNSYTSAAVCMHKAWTKQIAENHGVPIVPFIEVKKNQFQTNPQKIIQKIEELFDFPVWIKPVHLGSSIGVHRAEDQTEAIRFMEENFTYSESILIEKEIVGRQIEFSLIGNDWIEIAEPGEILSEGAFVGYDQKYGESAMSIQTPANLTELEKQVGQELAKKVYLALECKGLARIDFFLDQGGYFWLNEVNPFPGFTKTSAFPKMWQASGKKFPDLLDDLVVLGLHRAWNRFKIKL